jgi:hypothetical protein
MMPAGGRRPGPKSVPVTVQVTVTVTVTVTVGMPWHRDTLSGPGWRFDRTARQAAGRGRMTSACTPVHLARIRSTAAGSAAKRAGAANLGEAASPVALDSLDGDGTARGSGARRGCFRGRGRSRSVTAGHGAVGIQSKAAVPRAAAASVQAWHPSRP